AAMARSMAAADPPPLVRRLLEQDWARLLSLTNLGEGPQSLSYRNRLAVAGRLIALFDRAHQGVPAHRDEEAFLAHEIEHGLARVGPDETESMVDRALRAACRKAASQPAVAATSRSA